MEPTKNKQEIRDWYIEQRPVYKKLTSKIESILCELIEEGKLNVHDVHSRTKDIDSFFTKISKKSYKEPTVDVHDLTGIRIITYVESDVAKVSKIIKQVFKIDLKNSIDKKEELGIDRVGYQSVHFVAELKSDRIKLPEYKKFKNLKFEIQIRTILQHAWAEIEHDRNYKFSGQLPAGIKRRFTVLAGALELADREFNSIANEIDSISENVIHASKKGELDIEINSTTLNSYLGDRILTYGKKKPIQIEPSKSEDNEIIKHLNLFKVDTLDKLNNLIDDKYIDAFLKHVGDEGEYFDFLANLLLYRFSEEFFKKVDTEFYPFIFKYEVDMLEDLGVEIMDIIAENKIDINYEGS